MQVQTALTKLYVGKQVVYVLTKVTNVNKSTLFGKHVVQVWLKVRCMQQQVLHAGNKL